jgi:hypothetical protein
LQEEGYSVYSFRPGMEDGSLIILIPFRQLKVVSFVTVTAEIQQGISQRHACQGEILVQATRNEIFALIK